MILEIIKKLRNYKYPRNKMEKQNEYHVTLSTKGLLTIPISLRKKYHLEKGSDLKIIDEGGKFTVIPYTTASELFGIAKGYEKEMHEMILEQEQEHRENALNE